MRLLEILSTLDDAALFELRDEHLSSDLAESRSDVCLNLERELRSPNHVRSTVFNLQPPGFCILTELLEADAHATSFSSLKERVMERALTFATRVSTGDLAAGNRDRDVYRRVFVEARRSDLELDPSEVKLLAILRQALRLRTIEHFLMEHHHDFHLFWRTDHAFLDVMHTLRGRGLAFVVDGALRLPTDLAPTVQHLLGLEASQRACRRLYGRIANDDLKLALERAELKLGGAKEDRIQRLLDHYVQPREVLDTMALSALRDLCRDANIGVSGSKDDLVERTANHFASGWDLRLPDPPPPPAPPEERCLSPEAFDRFFGSLRGEELGDILTGIEASRVTGSKESKIKVLKGSRWSEQSLLLHLDAKQLDGILSKRRLRGGGSKRDRVARLLEDAARVPLETAPASVDGGELSDLPDSEPPS
jgi:hypothetical protein